MQIPFSGAQNVGQKLIFRSAFILVFSVCIGLMHSAFGQKVAPVLIVNRSSNEKPAYISSRLDGRFVYVLKSDLTIDLYESRNNSRNNSKRFDSPWQKQSKYQYDFPNSTFYSGGLETLVIDNGGWNYVKTIFAFKPVFSQNGNSVSIPVLFKVSDDGKFGVLSVGKLNKIRDKKTGYSAGAQSEIFILDLKKETVLFREKTVGASWSASFSDLKVKLSSWDRLYEYDLKNFRLIAESVTEKPFSKLLQVVHRFWKTKGFKSDPTWDYNLPKRVKIIKLGLGGEYPIIDSNLYKISINRIDSFKINNLDKLHRFKLSENTFFSIFMINDALYIFDNETFSFKKKIFIPANERLISHSEIDTSNLIILTENSFYELDLKNPESFEFIDAKKDGKKFKKRSFYFDSLWKQNADILEIEKENNIFKRKIYSGISDINLFQQPQYEMFDFKLKAIVKATNFSDLSFISSVRNSPSLSILEIKGGYKIGNRKQYGEIGSADISRKEDRAIISKKSKYWNQLLCQNAKGKVLWKKFLATDGGYVKISMDDQFVAVDENNEVISLYNMKDGEKFLSLYMDYPNNKWALWSPTGYFDCSPGGEDLLTWRVDRGPDSLPAFYPASRFRSTFYRPDLIDKIYAARSEKVVLSSPELIGSTQKTGNVVAQSAPPVIHFSNLGNNDFFSDTAITVKYHFTAGGNSTRSIKIYVDGRPFQTIQPDRSGLNSINLNLPARNLSLGLVAVNASGESEMALVRLLWKGKDVAEDNALKGNLYVLAIGISKYKKDNLKLAYAAKDASDFASSFKGQEKGLYKNIEIKLLTDSLATREKIESGLEWLAAQTTNRDVAVLYLAGHGENDNNGNFFFFPQGADEERLLSTCVHYGTLKSTVVGIPGKVLLFVDACRSGNVFGDLSRRSVDVTGLINELASTQSGVIVFTSSTGKQSSLEKSEWNNGAFTKAVVEGLGGKADLFDRGYISVKNLNAYISDRVKELTKGFQSPTSIMPESINDYPILLNKK